MVQIPESRFLLVGTWFHDVMQDFGIDVSLSRSPQLFCKDSSCFTDPRTLSFCRAAATNEEVSASPVLNATLEVSEQMLIMVAV